MAKLTAKAAAALHMIIAVQSSDQHPCSRLTLACCGAQVLVASNDREVAVACTGNEIFPIGALTLLKDMRKVWHSHLAHLVVDPDGKYDLLLDHLARHVVPCSMVCNKQEAGALQYVKCLNWHASMLY